MAAGAISSADISTNLMNSIPADVMDEFNAAGDVPNEEYSEPEPESLETPEPVGEPEEIPAEEPLAEEVPAAEAAPPAATEELPEGVVAAKNGKGVYVDQKRWNEVIHANHKMVQRVSDLFGEPATMEAIQLRDKAYQAQEKMFSDLESGDKDSQAQVLDFIFDELSAAKQNGRVGLDPSVPLATAFAEKLEQKSPEGYAAIRGSFARKMVSEMYAEAARSGDKNLFLSIGHVARWLAQSPDGDPAQIRQIAKRQGIDFYTPEEMDGLARGADPLTLIQRENQTLREQLNGRQNTNQTAQFDSWRSQTDQAITAAVVDEAVKPALQSIEEAWKPFPAEYNELVVDRLKAKVDKTLGEDQAFKSRIGFLTSQAKRATSQQVREQLAGEITRAFSNRAKLAAEAHRREVIDFANTAIKGKSADTHARLKAGSTRTAPQGATSPVTRSLVPPSALQPKPGQVYDPQQAFKAAMALIG